MLHHDIFTSGIGYLRVLFHTNRIPDEDLPYAALLRHVLSLVDTEHYSYSDLTSEINLNTGGLSLGITSYVNLKKLPDFTGAFSAEVRVLYEKLDFGFEIVSEILTRSKFSDEKRLGEILKTTRSRMKMKLENGSHSAAVARATSYFSPTSAYNDCTGGIRYYQFLDDVIREFEKDPKPLIAKLEEVSKKLFTKENMLISYTCDKAGFPALSESMKHLTDALPEGEGTVYPFQFRPELKNEGFKTSSQVNYVARCGNFRLGEEKLDYTGALRILKLILSYDYLWQNLRVKGGAYGCMSGFGRSGEGYFVSYRDPKMKETNEVYEGIVDYLEHFDASDRDMTKYVIGTIGAMDTPFTPADQGARGLSAYLSGVTDEMMQEERDQVLAATQKDIQNLAGIVKAILKTGALCAIGNEEKVEENREMFGEVKNLFRA